MRKGVKSFKSRLSEWSNEPDLRPGVVKRVGFEPHTVQFHYSLTVRMRPFQG